MGVNFRETFCQHDRAWPHTAKAVLDMLNDHSDERVLSNNSDMDSTNQHTLQILTHGDFFLWSSLKNIVYRNNEHMPKEPEL
jgi:hypothetical protein